MSQIVIAGIGQTPVGEHWDLSLRQLGVAAIRQAIADAGGLQPQLLVAGNMLAPLLSNQAHVGTLLADFAGLEGIEAWTVEAADASGAAALRQAYLAVKSGFVDVAIAVGVEKATDRIGADQELALATFTDSDYELEQGMTPAAAAALLARLYLHRYDVPREALGAFPLLAHANAVHNPNAMFRKAITAELYARAGVLQDPLNLFDGAPFADGAAAVVVTRADLLPPDRPAVAIRSSAVVTDMLALHDRSDLLDFPAARESFLKALANARLEIADVDFFEYFDSYSIYAALTLEACGLAPRGGATRMAAEGAFNRDGQLPCATLGGLKARGHAGGATGLYQVVEAVQQLRGTAGAGQIAGARIGVTQALGSAAAIAVTHVLERAS